MATSVIQDKQRDFIRKMYDYTYTAGADSRYNLTAANFGITAISGYTPIGVYRATSGSSNVSVRGVNAITSGNVMYVYNKTSSTASSITAMVGIVWMRDDLVAS